MSRGSRGGWIAALCAAAALAGAAPSRALADWKREFAEVCGKTQDAMTLPAEELRTLVARCDALAPVIAALEETERRVFSRRLQACRDLYQFVLDTRDKEPAP